MPLIDIAKLTPLSQKILAEVAKTPYGQTATYKTIALKVGTSPRVVGNILHKNPDPTKYPCHRVIRSNGTLALGYAFGGINQQKKLLCQEGIQVFC